MATDSGRPLLAWERASKDYDAGNRRAFDGLPRPPHCDPRILHHPQDGCDFCNEATVLQEERAILGISNSGHSNRMYPCPADQARSKEQYSAWPGNRAKTYEQLDKEAAAFAQQLRDLGLVVDK